MDHRLDTLADARTHRNVWLEGFDQLIASTDGTDDASFWKRERRKLANLLDEVTRIEKEYRHSWEQAAQEDAEEARSIME